MVISASVQRATGQTHCGLGDRLSEGWMGVDGSSHVLDCGGRFDSQSCLAGKLGDMGSYGLNADDRAVSVGDNRDETICHSEGGGPAGCGQGEAGGGCGDAGT
jgi:hypothetical protein